MMFYASQVVGDWISEPSTVGTGIFSGIKGSVVRAII